MSVPFGVVVVAAVTALSCGAAPPAAGSAPVAPTDTPVVVEVLDRQRSPGGRGRRLADAAVLELTGEAEVVSAWEELVAGRSPVVVRAAEGDGAPPEVLLRTVASRLRLAAGPAEPDMVPAGLVVVATGHVRGGRLVCTTGAAAPAAVLLAVCDLQNVTSDDGWSWEAGILVAGRDPVAVDRVALRILDSARIATGAPPLETDPVSGDARLAAAAEAGGGTADLASIRWRKALTPE